MTVSSETSRWAYTGDASTTVFAYTNKIFVDADLSVTVDGVVQTITTDYTVSGAGDESGGNVTFVTAPANATDVLILRSVTDDQQTDYPVGGAFPAESTEDALDKRTIISQQQQEELDRALKTDVDDTEFNARSKKIISLATGVSDNDAVNTAQLSSAILSVIAGTHDLSGLIREHDTIANAVADSSYTVGQTIVLVKEYATGKGIINAPYDVVASGTGTEDGFEYHDDTIDGSTFQLQLRIPEGKIDVRLAGAHNDGTTDVTVAVQAVVDYAESTGNNNIVYFPAGQYLITDTIDIYEGFKCQGDNIEWGGIAGATSFPNRLADARGTVIAFEPTSQASLFVPVLPKGGSAAWSSIGIEDLQIWGNSDPSDFHGGSSSNELSLYALDFLEVQYSMVSRVSITGFVNGIREGDRCQVNFYKGVHIERCRYAAVVYSETTTGVEPTSSVWDKCVFRTCESGVEMISTSGSPQAEAFHIRFTDCYIEDMAAYGFRLSKGCRNWVVKDCYGESLGRDSGVADRAAFSVGKFGNAGYTETYNLAVIGGQFSGPSTPAGTFLDVDQAEVVYLTNTEMKRFTNGIVTTANSRDNCVHVFGLTYNAITNFLTGTTSKIFGMFRTGILSGSSDIAEIRSQFVRSDIGLELIGTTLRLGDGSTIEARPGADNTMDLGNASTRWAEVFAAIGTINTSDARYKEFQEVTEVEKRVAKRVKTLIGAYRLKESIEKKGNGARVHFGVPAQALIEAFAEEGLDAHNYGMFCYDEWDDKFNEDGSLQAQAGNRYGVRYDELLAFVVAYS